MILGGLAWFIAMTGLYAFSERQSERFVAALPADETARLPNKRAGFGIGLILYELARGRLLATPADDRATEQLRRRAVLWRRWWPWVSFAFFPPFVFAGAGLSALGIGIDRLPSFNDLRAIIQGLLIIGVALYVARLLWERRPPRDIRRR